MKIMFSFVEKCFKDVLIQIDGHLKAEVCSAVELYCFVL